MVDWRLFMRKSSMSIFARERAGTSPQAPAEPQGSSDARFIDLKRRYDALKERKTTLRVEAEHAARAVEECRQRAKQDFGVDTLDALDALAEEQFRKEAEELAKFEADLTAEELRVAQVESELAQLGA
jgi:hypothetical protein